MISAKNRLNGEYPSTFLERALGLFPDGKQIVHCPSGTAGTGADHRPSRETLCMKHIAFCVKAVTWECSTSTFPHIE
jgi:hypothetical protein